jgi:hypothetical protein
MAEVQTVGNSQYGVTGPNLSPKTVLARPEIAAT